MAELTDAGRALLRDGIERALPPDLRVEITDPDGTVYETFCWPTHEWVTGEPHTFKWRVYRREKPLGDFIVYADDVELYRDDLRPQVALPGDVVFDVKGFVAI